MFYVKGKGYFEESGRAVGSKRKIDLARANVYGKENDVEAFTTLIVESRVSRELLQEAFNRGRNAMLNAGKPAAPVKPHKPLPAPFSAPVSIFDL